MENTEEIRGYYIGIDCIKSMGFDFAKKLLELRKKCYGENDKYNKGFEKAIKDF